MRRRFTLLCCLLAVLTGCAARPPASYRYANRILIPPSVETASITERTLKLPIAAKCSSSEEGLAFIRTGRSIRVTVNSKQLVAHSPGWLTSWGAKLERQGCLPAGQGAELALRVSELLPLDPAVAYRLLHAHVDLGPQNTLKVTGPILREGAKPDATAIESTHVSGTDQKLTVTLRGSSALLGYETAWYALEPNANGPGTRIVATQTEDHVGDQVTRPEHPQLDFLHFPPEAAFYRLFYMTRLSRTDHDINILAAPTLIELEDQTARFEADPDFCAKAAPMCVMVPRETAVNPHISVTAQNKRVNVPVGAAVRDAIQTAGVAVPDTVLATLVVKRLNAGVLVSVLFDRAKPEILMLPLAGGETLAW